MDIVISFEAKVGIVKALKTIKSISFEPKNNSIAMWLKNKKFPYRDGSINSRDANKKYPPSPDIPGLIAIILRSSEYESESYTLNEYLSDIESSIAGFFYWGYAAEINTKITRKHGKQNVEGSISTTGELGSPNLNYSFFVPYGPYEGSGGSGSYESESPESTSSLLSMNRSQYESSFAGKPSSGASESSQEVTGTTDVLGKPYSEESYSFSSFSAKVFFKKT